MGSPNFQKLASEGLAWGISIKKAWLNAFAKLAKSKSPKTSYFGENKYYCQIRVVKNYP